MKVGFKIEKIKTTKNQRCILRQSSRLSSSSSSNLYFWFVLVLNNVLFLLLLVLLLLLDLFHLLEKGQPSWTKLSFRRKRIPLDCLKQS